MFLNCEPITWDEVMDKIDEEETRPY
jgi:hypothetical protein